MAVYSRVFVASLSNLRRLLPEWRRPLPQQALRPRLNPFTQKVASHLTWVADPADVDVVEPFPGANFQERFARALLRIPNESYNHFDFMAVSELLAVVHGGTSEAWLERLMTAQPPLAPEQGHPDMTLLELPVAFADALAASMDADLERFADGWARASDTGTVSVSDVLFIVRGLAGIARARASGDAMYFVQ